MKQRIAQLIGIGHILLHVSAIIMGTLMMPMGVYFYFYPQRIPPSLSSFYHVFSWEWGVMMVSTFYFYLIIGFVFIFFGWKLMHPLKSRPIDILARRSLLVENSKEVNEKVLEQLKMQKLEN
jgi:hypothetical protein